jgi:N-acetylmuramic acid 6-phosphate etherase
VNAAQPPTDESALSPTERRHPDSIDLDGRSTRDVLALMNDADATVPGAVRRALPQIERVVDETVARWRRGGRLFYFGAGTSGRLGVLDASECPPTFSSPPEQVQGFIAGGDVALRRAVEGAEDDAAAGAAAVAAAHVGAADVVVGLAASGTTPYVLGALRAARERGAFTASVVCNPGSPLSRAADVAIELDVGPELITGSTRLKAGTAQKLALNMVTTASMVRSGKVYGNLMVDLTATNEKLRRRAARIVAQVAGIDPAAAVPLLEQTGYRAKPAILMALTGCTAADADQRLVAAGGVLRLALESVAPSGAEQRQPRPQ